MGGAWRPMRMPRLRRKRVEQRLMHKCDVCNRCAYWESGIRGGLTQASYYIVVHIPRREFTERAGLFDRRHTRLWPCSRVCNYSGVLSHALGKHVPNYLRHCRWPVETWCTKCAILSTSVSHEMHVPAEDAGASKEILRQTQIIRKSFVRPQ